MRTTDSLKSVIGQSVKYVLSVSIILAFSLIAYNNLEPYSTIAYYVLTFLNTFKAVVILVSWLIMRFSFDHYPARIRRIAFSQRVNDEKRSNRYYLNYLLDVGFSLFFIVYLGKFEMFALSLLGLRVAYITRSKIASSILDLRIELNS